MAFAVAYQCIPVWDYEKISVIAEIYTAYDCNEQENIELKRQDCSNGEKVLYKLNPFQSQMFFFAFHKAAFPLYVLYFYDSKVTLAEPWLNTVENLLYAAYINIITTLFILS